MCGAVADRVNIGSPDWPMFSPGSRSLTLPSASRLGVFAPLSARVASEWMGMGWNRVSCTPVSVRLMSSLNSGPFPPPGLPSRIRSSVGFTHATPFRNSPMPWRISSARARCSGVMRSMLSARLRWYASSSS